MNVYDTANKLAQEIKDSKEYNNYKMAKQVINLKTDLKNKIDEFENARYEAQMLAIQTGKTDEEKIAKVQKLYVELLEDSDAKNFLEAQTQFNTLIADVNKIIGDSIKDVL